MTMSRTAQRLVIATALWLAATAAGLGAQDTLARAKDFYAAAAYEEALNLLQRLGGSSSPVESNEVAAYQVFCLVALGRSDEAKRTIETIVKTDPLYKLSATQASPRVRAFFDDVRRPLLPEIIKQSYSKAKDAYEQKDNATAAKEFDRVIALIDEVGTTNDRGLADLRTLASGFRDLSKAAVAAATPPPPPPAPDAPAAASNSPSNGTSAATNPASKPATPASPATEPTYGPKDTNVTRPMAINRTMPEWRPSAVEAMMEFRGSIEVLIGTDGKVISAVITDSVHPNYDEPLRKAAMNWTFKPATKGGKPVRYRYAVDIQLKKLP
jgi:outer membrane biosynthesis protein TonB